MRTQVTTLTRGPPPSLFAVLGHSDLRYMNEKNNREFGSRTQAWEWREPVWQAKDATKTNGLTLT